jgi:putative acetyltransferase
VRLLRVRTPPTVATARRLFREYVAEVATPECFEGFEEEVAALPAPYHPPAGALLLAEVGGRPAGVVGIRRRSSRICEMKRLYVRPVFRGLGLGRALASRIVAEARRLGYTRMRLDSLESMAVARAMYRSLGFVEIPPYLPATGLPTHYMELRLTGRGAARARPGGTFHRASALTAGQGRRRS